MTGKGPYFIIILPAGISDTRYQISDTSYQTMADIKVLLSNKTRDRKSDIISSKQKEAVGKMRRRRELIGGTIFFIFAAVYFVMALRIPEKKKKTCPMIMIMIMIYGFFV